MSDRPVLVVDDDPKIVSLIGAYLARAGYEVITAGDGMTAQRKIREELPRLVVLDVMLPQLDGLELTRALRERHHTVPILMMSARGALDDRLRGLVEGADDYLAKPFSPAELVERVNAILRRTEGSPDRIRRHGDLSIDLERHLVERAGRPVELSPAEYRLLVALVRAEGRVLSREQLLDELHGLAEADTLGRAIDVHMSRLRSKLGERATGQRYFATVRGVGYRAAAGQT